MLAVRRLLTTRMDLAASWPLPAEPALRDALLAAWGDPARRYHDLRHLTEVCARVEELTADAGAGFDPLAVRLAAWFHDAVYDDRPAPEERSAVWARTALTEAGSPPGLVAEVARLVRLTEHHRPAEGDRNGAVLSDADLAILAAPARRYRQYVAAVREEYAEVPDPAFRAGRAEVLGRLLDKPHLFHTAYAREHWEAAARSNATRELAELT